MSDAASAAIRLFITTGVVRRFVLGGFWSLLFLRFVTDLELEPLELVLLGTAQEVTILLSEIPTGVVADVYSRKWSVVFSFWIMGPAIVALAFVEPFAAVLVAQILIAFGSTFESGAETAWVTDEIGSPEATEPVLLRRARLQLIASVLGVITFGALGAVATLSTALAAIGAIYLAWGFWLAVAMPETGFTRSEASGWSEFADILRAGGRECRHIPALRTLVIGVLIGGLAKEAIDRLDIQRLVDVGFPDDINEVAVVAVIVAVKSLLAMVALTVVARRADASSVVPAMTLLIGLTAVGVLALAQVDVLAIAALGLVVHGGTWLATEPVVATWANTFASSRQRATVHSFVGQAEAFGEIVGGIALGVVAQLAGVPTAMTISAALFATAALTFRSARGQWDESLPTG